MKHCFQYSSSIETDLSDHHCLIFPVMKTKLALEEPKILVYCNFKSFNNDYFEEELSSRLHVKNKDYAAFEDNLVNFFNKHAPKKTKIFRDKNKAHVSKTLRLVIMNRSCLKNKASKTQLPSDKQKNPKI